MLNVLIVDDEPLAHEVLLHHCRAQGDLAIVGQCHNAAEALAALECQRVDLMFLDVRMPRFGGLDLLRGLAAPPLTVIVSAHREHALDGFDLDVIDYLLKPVSAARFAEALGKVRRRIAAQTPPSAKTAQEIILKIDRTLRRFSFAEIAFFQAQGNFVLVSGPGGTVLATTTLKALREALPAESFVQVHKSYIVSRAAIVAQRSDRLELQGGALIPVGKSFRGGRFMVGNSGERAADQALQGSPSVSDRSG